MTTPGRDKLVGLGPTPSPATMRRYGRINVQQPGQTAHGFFVLLHFGRQVFIGKHLFGHNFGYAE